MDKFAVFLSIITYSIPPENGKILRGIIFE
jgi:hypothetical protein